MKTPILFLLALAALPWAASAQSYDSSGDKMLSGAYYIRQVIYAVESAGDVNIGCVDTGSCDMANAYGTITFDGNGNYSFSGWYLDSASSTAPVQYNTTGTYVISAAGMGYITAINPNLVNSTDQIIGLVNAKGIFIGSTTLNTEGYNDLVIAAPVGSSVSNSTFNGTYQVAYFDPTYFPTNAAVSGGNAILTMSPNGSGNIGSVNVTGYVGTNAASSETLNGVTYSFTNGAAQLNFGGTAGSGLIAGTELLYISPDGSFVFGGSADGFDMFVGVRAATSNPTNYNAFYYQAGIDLDNTTVGNGYVLLDTYYGALSLFTDQFGTNDIIGHQSLNWQLVYNGTEDYTYYDSYTLNGDGSSTDIDYAQKYFSSQDGTIRVGYGNTAGLLSLNVAMQAPSLSGSGVYLNPQGMVNAASSAPFTAHLSPGEFLTLYGSGLAPSAASAPSLPLTTNLNGVQVFINGLPVPILFVSPTQLNVIVPYTSATIAQIQVNNNGTNSNTVTQFIGETSNGVFTIPSGGIYDAAALHAANYTVVSESSPAQIGETVAVFVDGLGAVSPASPAGAAGPSSTLSSAVNQPQVYLADSAGNYIQANENAALPFAGLAPGFAGLYQINFTVPSGLAAGEASLEIFEPTSDSDTFESVMCITSCSSSAAVPATAHAKSGERPMLHPHQNVRRNHHWSLKHLSATKQ
jgi:uncharacterized protein (TIGR03437 family)